MERESKCGDLIDFGQIAEQTKGEAEIEQDTGVGRLKPSMGIVAD
jgi:hypothetical protein